MRLSKNRNLFLVGPMAVGQTTIGKLLARELRLQFIDSDQEIEKKAGADIPWIFDVEGEEKFRDRESSVIDELTQREGILLATGGGSVLRKENRRYLQARGIVRRGVRDLRAAALGPSGVPRSGDRAPRPQARERVRAGRRQTRDSTPRLRRRQIRGGGAR